MVVEDATGSPRADEVRALRLELVGQDRPGIIHEISATLASSGVNVVELSTRTSPAAMSGETLFSASALLHQPIGESAVALRDHVEKLAEDLMVEITLTEA